MSGDEKAQIIGASAARVLNLGDAPEQVERRYIANCRRADPAYGSGVEEA